MPPRLRPAACADFSRLMHDRLRPLFHICWQPCLDTRHHDKRVTARGYSAARLRSAERAALREALLPALYTHCARLRALCLRDTLRATYYARLMRSDATYSLR